MARHGKPMLGHDDTRVSKRYMVPRATGERPVGARTIEGRRVRTTRYEGNNYSV